MVRITLTLVSLTILLAGCGSSASQGAPNDLLITYQWRDGTVPPPYHYQYTIQIQADGQGTIVMIPGYSADDAPTWTEPFTLSQAELDQLYATMVAQGLHREPWRSEELPPIGGSSANLTVVANGRTTEIPSFPIERQQAQAQAIMDAVRNSVPLAIFTDLMQRREQFIAENS
ncbi:MAG: hypothetical protein AB4911_21680 [Oscillochloridaceae bacterium umkhey_bin13]